MPYHAESICLLRYKFDLVVNLVTDFKEKKKVKEGRYIKT